MNAVSNILSNIGSSLVRRLVVVFVLEIVIRGIGFLVAPSSPADGVFVSDASSAAAGEVRLIASPSDPLMADAIAYATGDDSGFGKAPSALSPEEVRVANEEYRRLSALRRSLANSDYSSIDGASDGGWGTN